MTAALLLAVAAAAAPDGTGRAIYQRGVLGSGAPLEGVREQGAAATGIDAACISCHERSGLGTVEGNNRVPPITGEYLFHSRDPALPWVEGMNGNRDPYTDASLARAIREGVDTEGRRLNYLMPRYALGDADMAALIAYLRTLDARRVPGVTDSVLHFATIVTPDAEPLHRRGVLDVLESFFAQRSYFPLKPTPQLLASGRTQYAKGLYMANRRWQLHVWELTGRASTWRAQLEDKLAAQPVYAVLSGAAGSDFGPVHDFCEEDAIPCLFPNVEVPVHRDGDFYTLYFSKGVLLEAELIAQRLLAEGARSVEQVFRKGDSGERAADALAARLELRGVRLRRTALAANARPAAVTAAVRAATKRAATLVLWLRPPDLAALEHVGQGDAAVYFSGLLGGLEKSPLPAGWRERARMTYPFDLPDRRGVRLDYPLGWFAHRRIPVVAEQVQADTYLACTLLADVLNRMADNFARPYLVEQLQTLLEHRLITGYYPRLALATNQRFASKGGFVVHFRDRGGTALVADGDWTVP